MPESGEGRSARATLAGQVEPVRRWLVGFFRRQSPGEADVDDLVQEVFARIVARDSEEPIDNLNGYVMRTASSVMADNLRRRSTRRASYHVPYDPELHGGDEEFDPERVLSGKEELNA
ncbi:MAG TPA: sigma factor, partial [Sphingomicrobium sp.]